MGFKFKLPDIGEGVEEAQVLEWLVKEGDVVKEDDPIVRVETDKAVADIPSPRSGKIIRVNKKDVIRVGELLVEFEGGEEEKDAGSVVGELEESVERIAPQRVVKALPKVKKLAKDLGVDISKIKGSGEDGRVTESDVRSSVEGSVRVVKKYDLFGHVKRVPLKGLRKTIANNMSKQVTVPIVTHHDEVDITNLHFVKEFEKSRVKGVKLTYLPFIIKAVVHSLKKHPLVNSSLEGDEIIVKEYYNIGVAVATDDGLIVPVIKGADQKNVYQLAEEIERLAEKARNRSIDLMDLKGGTFTITNYGSVGGLFATPIMNVGEVAILGLGRAHDKPVVVNGKVVVRRILPFSVSFDHRVLDGAEVASFANTFKQFLESKFMNPKTSNRFVSKLKRLVQHWKEI